MAESFDAGVELRWLRGPFEVRVTIDEGYIELIPSAIGELFRGRGPFKAERASREEILCVHLDSRRRRGLRIKTTGGGLDRFVVVPSTNSQRDAIHRAFETHGYPIAP